MRLLSGAPFLIYIELVEPCFCEYAKTKGIVGTFIPIGTIGLIIDEDSIDLISTLSKAEKKEIIPKIIKHREEEKLYYYWFGDKDLIGPLPPKIVRIVQLIPEAETWKDIADLCGMTEEAVRERLG